MLFEEIKRAEVYTELLGMFSNGKTQGNWPHRIEAEINTMAKEIYYRAEDLQFSMQPADLNINPEYLLRIVLELTDNALKFSKKDQKVHITGKVIADSYVIEIRDIGKGFILESLD